MGTIEYTKEEMEDKESLIREELYRIMATRFRVDTDGKSFYIDSRNQWVEIKNNRWVEIKK